MLKMVISGAQTGADYIGLVMAKYYGIPTSGYIPKGWKTLDGPKPQYKELFNIKEHSSSGYKERTWDNALWGDGTIRIATDFNSPGEKCTLNGIKAHGKPYFDVHFGPYGNVINGATIEKAVVWIKENKIEILNVAGNTKQTSPHIEMYARVFLEKLFKALGHEKAA